jgi:hypothetical protein
MLAPARAVLGEKQWGAAFAAGRALTFEEAVAEALLHSLKLRLPMALSTCC